MPWCSLIEFKGAGGMNLQKAREYVLSHTRTFLALTPQMLPIWSVIKRKQKSMKLMSPLLEPLLCG